MFSLKTSKSVGFEDFFFFFCPTASGFVVYIFSFSLIVLNSKVLVVFSLI